MFIACDPIVHDGGVPGLKSPSSILALDPGQNQALRDA